MAVSDELMRRHTGIGGGGTVYSIAMANNSVIEEQIGLTLAKDSRVAQFAHRINAAAAIPGANALPLRERGDIDKQKGTFGGAQAATDGVDTLGKSVFEAMHHIERNKDFYSRVHNSEDHRNPYFGGLNNKKPEFDQPLSTAKWAELPIDLKGRLDPGGLDSPFQSLAGAVYNVLPSDAKKIILSEYQRNSITSQITQNNLVAQLGAPGAAMTALPVGVPIGVAALVGIVHVNLAPPINKVHLRGSIAAAIMAIGGVGGVALEPLKAELGALYDIVADEHTSGDNTNLVQLDKDSRGYEVDNEKNRWIKDTIAAGKPIISGPSGHTLRYLNFWAEQRMLGGVPAAWPSLEAARLVMMADLMPPKHHSYDEIMTASIGISDRNSTLRYLYKSSYEDLNTHVDREAAPVAAAAFGAATAAAVAQGIPMPANDPNIDILSDVTRQSISTLVKKLQDNHNAPTINTPFTIAHINTLIEALPH